MPVQEFAKLDGAVNLLVIANATPEEFALSGVDCNRQLKSAKSFYVLPLK